MFQHKPQLFRLSPDLFSQEGKLIKRSVEALKKEINNMKAENIKISKKVSIIEKDMESETDENSEIVYQPGTISNNGAI